MSRCVTARSAGRRLIWPTWAVADGMSCRTGTACSGVGVMITPIPGPAEVITAGPLHAAGVTVTGVDIDELDTTLTTGPWRGREAAQATARIEFTTAGTAERRQMPVRIGYTLAMAAATGAPVRVARPADGPARGRRPG